MASDDSNNNGGRITIKNLSERIITFDDPIYIRK
jgi:hypothetical protein